MTRPFPDILKRPAQAHMDSIKKEEPRLDDQPFVQATIKRLRDGNKKIWDRWDWMGQANLSLKESSTYMEGWDQAVEAVIALGDKLAAIGYNKCIYGVEVRSFEDCPRQKEGNICFSCLVS